MSSPSCSSPVARPTDPNADETRRAIALLGYLGHMVSGSKSGYRNQCPQHLVVFNARVCTREFPGVIWYGDLDVTASRADLRELAHDLGQRVFVCWEMDADPDGRALPQFDQAAYDTDGETERFRHAPSADIVPDAAGRRGRTAAETATTARFTPIFPADAVAAAPAARRNARRPKRTRWQDLHSLETDTQPVGEVLPLPDLTTFEIPAVRGDPVKTMASRLHAWYAYLMARADETVEPYVGAVWLHPADAERLRQWVAAPLRRRVPAFRRAQIMGFTWLNSGPATSLHVPEGQLILERDAFQRTRDRQALLRKTAPPAPKPELPAQWTCPGCGHVIDITAARSWMLQPCACRRYAIDWERATRILRVIGPSNPPLGPQG